MGLHKEVVTLTSAADGTGTATATNSITGFLVQIDYIKIDFADGVAATFNAVNSLVTDAIVTIAAMNAAVRIFPRGFATTLAGTAETSATQWVMVGGRPSVTVTGAGNAKSGTFIFWWMD
jgi:hypothetical protein